MTAKEGGYIYSRFRVPGWWWSFRGGIPRIFNKPRRNMVDVRTISIDGVDYVRADTVGQTAQKLDGMPYKIVRTYSAGVFAGYVEGRNGQEVVLRNVRRLWYWSGAASLSQLALQGVTKPRDCKFALPVDRIEVLQAIEIIDCTEAARKNIEGVPAWKI